MITKSRWILLCFFAFICLIFAPGVAAKGKFEFGFHYGSWNINIIASPVENAIADSLKTQFLDSIKEDHPDLEDVDFTSVVDFDSSGSNYGFEARWYPGGESGSFSLGLSLEKTSMKVGFPQVSGDLKLTEGGMFQADASGSFLIKPLSFHLSLRWDIKPSWRVHPYLTFGLGMAGGSALEKAEISYSFSGSLNIPGEPVEQIEESETKTLKQLKDDMEAEGEEFFLPGFFPFIQLNLGLKGRVAENVYLLVDAGIWDGILFRGGVAVRF